MPFQFKAGDYPDKPGCYLMRDASGRLLYVGKSKKLRSRLRSYFHTHHKRKRLRELVGLIDSIEVLLVNNETESLLLENNLIKIHKPPYNRALKKDNSGYAYLMLTAERIPRLDVYYRDRREQGGAPSSAEEASQACLSLQPKDRNASNTSNALNEPDAPNASRKGWNHSASSAPTASTTSAAVKNSPANAGLEPKRFGPFASARFRNELLEFVADHYKLRSCTKLPKRACLLYHIGKCSGICEGHISEEEYGEKVKQVSDLLFSGSKEALIAQMYRQMGEYAEQLKFEKAQNMLGHIRNLEKTPDKQIVDRETNVNQEVLYFGEEGVMIAKVQEGMLRDLQLHELERGYGEAACDRFLIHRYRHNTKPDELIVNAVSDPGAVRRALRMPGDGRARPLLITQPKRGLKHALLQLCKENYEYRKGGG
ncbi:MULTISPECIES: GIY-YIG nuclease family protein [unclassified Paenibacillus]|uniref:GIY-YIG nuclease family protein n=1 Tax=unclassified Paenibacillus TaxID=185978 RepID=UPI00095699D6|nr:MULTISPECIES: GIY-YIG nuclease family protein [unclassified Paenibacillus]SIR35403.1 excinuclease ABC subunit C [Paenibacillus sp. RU4X]SIR46207.1 excinuclease ABC subunit C [Paenibacillus sp. RU4T]